MDGAGVATRCRNCGESLEPGGRFCHMCGAGSGGDDLAGALSAALREYAALLDALAAGQITPEVFQERALEVGTVRYGQALFLLDAGRRTWHRYDGVTMTDGVRFASEETTPSDAR